MNTKDPNSTFPEWLQEQMDGRGLNGADMARIAEEKGVNISAQTISNILNRKRGLGVDVAKAIAVIFGVSEDQIFKAGGLQTEQSGTMTIEEDEMLHVFRNLGATDRRILIDTGKVMDKHRTASGEHRRKNVAKRNRGKGDASNIPKPDGDG